MKLNDFVKNNVSSISAQTYAMEIQALTRPMATKSEAYNRFRDINHKYGKLPLKPGFQKGKLSIDVGETTLIGRNNDYTTLNNSDLLGVENARNNTGLQTAKTINASSRSRSIEPNVKKLARLPETSTKKIKPSLI